MMSSLEDSISTRVGRSSVGSAAFPLNVDAAREESRGFFFGGIVCNAANEAEPSPRQAISTWISPEDQYLHVSRY